MQHHLLFYPFAEQGFSISYISNFKKVKFVEPVCGNFLK